MDRYFRLFRNHSMRVIDVREDLEDLTELVEVPDGEPLILHPGEFILGSTLERVGSPTTWSPASRASPRLGRLGLLIHSTAGLRGRRLGRPPHPRALQRRQPAHHRLPGLKIGQISFLRMTTPADQPYGTAGLGRSTRANGDPTPSRYFENFRP